MTRQSMIQSAALLMGAALSLWSPPSRADEPVATAPAYKISGPESEYTPLLRFEGPQKLLVQGDFRLDLRAEGATTFPVDLEGPRYDVGIALAPRLRAGLRADSGTWLNPVALHLEYEHDLPTGFWTSSSPGAGSELPSSAPIDHELRKLFLRLSIGPLLHAGGGFMTNQFGLGLVANDGATGDWTPGSARFADNRGGDRVLRGFIGTGPHTPARISATVALDSVQGDDALLPGDKAIQLSTALVAGHERPWGGGVFVVHRWQTAPDGAHTEVDVIDLAARFRSEGGPIRFSLEGEAALIVGQTTLGATPEIPTHDILQFGATARATVRGRVFGGALDFLFASGDRNPDDHQQTAFRADPNFEMGVLLYRHVLAAQTGRATATAGDPNLVGVASPGLERVPTRGSPTNTVAVFPRFYARPVDGLEIYGGPLLAWSAAPLFDPLNTRVAGGVLRNALGGAPGGFLGAELDAGVRFRMLIRGTVLLLGVEGAALMPGSAFVDENGNEMGPVLGGRALLQYRL